MKLTKAGLLLIKESEGLQLKAYPDPASGGSPWTIGYGHTGSEVKEGLEISLEKAEELLKTDLEKLEVSLSKLDFYKKTSDNGISAILSLVYNIGMTNFKISTLCKMLEKGEPVQETALEFVKWSKSSGTRMTGLVIRRAKETILFLSQ